MDIPRKMQSDIVLGFVGPNRAQPHYLTARLCNSILGVFGLYGRLGESVREKGGMAYYCYSQVEGGLGPGAWRVIAGVDPANVDKALPLIQAEIKRMIETKVTARELKDNKSYSIGSMPIGLETNDGVAGILLDMELYGLGLDYLVQLSRSDQRRHARADSGRRAAVSRSGQLCGGRGRADWVISNRNW